jgi:hypothetical protein
MHPLAYQMRELSKQSRAVDISALLQEAASELDRLYDTAGCDEVLDLENAQLKQELLDLLVRMEEYEPALQLIACGPLPNGTYNYCRDACRQLAKKALHER